MTPRAMFGMIITKWLLAIVLFVNYLFDPKDSFTKVAELVIVIQVKEV